MSLNISTKKTYSVNWKKTTDITSVVGECICDLQASLAQYIVISSVKHMELKSAVHNDDPEEVIVSKLAELDQYLWHSLEGALDTAHKYLLKYFSNRSKYPPRITMKAPFQKDLIVDLYRKDKSPYESFKVDENSAFKEIRDTGSYYICNDIPADVAAEKYINKRIDGSLVRSNYNPPGMLLSIWQSIMGKDGSDISWENCWDKDENDRPNSASCYKSTMVIPMTLINARLSREFIRYLFGESEVREEGKYEKLMFGFLCVDHRHTDYFNYHDDVRVGYILADILSLFLIVRKMYTQNSRVYARAKAIESK